MISVMDRWITVNRQLEDFMSFLSPKFQPLGIVHLYDKQNSQEEYDARDKSLFRKRGVYLCYNEQDKLINVGKAGDCFQKRIFKCVKDSHFKDIRYVDVICFDDRHAAFLVALEQFLISRLKPELNEQLKDYDIPNGSPRKNRKRAKPQAHKAYRITQNPTPHGTRNSPLA